MCKLDLANPLAGLQWLVIAPDRHQSRLTSCNPTHMSQNGLGLRTYRVSSLIRVTTFIATAMQLKRWEVQLYFLFLSLREKMSWTDLNEFSLNRWALLPSLKIKSLIQSSCTILMTSKKHEVDYAFAQRKSAWFLCPLGCPGHVGNKSVINLQTGQGEMTIQLVERLLERSLL